MRAVDILTGAVGAVRYARQGIGTGEWFGDLKNAAAVGCEVADALGFIIGDIGCGILNVCHKNLKLIYQ